MDELEARLKLEKEYNFFERNMQFIEKEYGRVTEISSPKIVR